MTDKASEILAGYGILLRHVRLGDMDLVYGEFQGWQGPCHWFLGVDGNGVSTASPLSDGPLGIAPDGEVPLDFLERGRGRSGADKVRAVSEGGVAETLALKLTNKGVSLGDGEDRAVAIAAIASVSFPLLSRLEGRLRLLELATAERSEHPLGLSRGRFVLNGQSRALFLTDAQVVALHRFQQRDALLLLAFGKEGIDLGAGPEALRADVLRMFGVSEPVIRKVRGPNRITASMAVLLASVPVDWVPEPGDADGWEVLGHVAALLRSSGTRPERWGSLVRASKGRWKPFLERCSAASYPDVGSGMHEIDRAKAQVVASGSRDVINGFREFLEGLSDGVGVGRGAKAKSIAEDAVIGGRGLVSLIEASRLWHERHRETAPPGFEWDPLLPDWTHADTGVEVVVLRSSNDLLDEGSRDGGLDHCVGSRAYVVDCLRNEVRILSMRRAGIRLSTAEVRLHPTDRGTTLVQHRGLRNAEPSPDAGIALEAYLSSDAVRNAASVVEQRHVHLPALEMERSVEILKAWRPYLTGRWRNVPIKEYRKLVAQGVVPAARVP